MPTLVSNERHEQRPHWQRINRFFAKRQNYVITSHTWIILQNWRNGATERIPTDRYLCQLCHWLSVMRCWRWHSTDNGLDIGLCLLVVTLMALLILDTHTLSNRYLICLNNYWHFRRGYPNQYIFEGSLSYQL